MRFGLRRGAVAVLVFGAIFFICTRWGYAAVINFNRIADFSTAVPDQSGTFDAFYPPAIVGTKVVFRGFDGSQQGAYLADSGSISRIVDWTTPVPDGTGTFETVLPPSFDGHSVAFAGQDSASNDGIYKASGGTVSVVADRNTPVPGATGNFTGFIRSSPNGFFPSIDNGTVAFQGHNSSVIGVYIDNGGTLSRVADTTTQIPNAVGAFTDFGNPSLNQGHVAFWGSGSNSQGIYLFDGTSITTIADTNTSVPNGTGNFTTLNLFPVTLDGANIVFEGGNSSRSGLYTEAGGTVTTVADSSTPIPGGTGTFAKFDEFAADGGAVAFTAEDANSQSGIYCNYGGSLFKIVATGDVLDGKTLNRFTTLYPEGMSGATVAFWARFTDGSEALYTATVPEPLTWPMFILGIIAIGLQRRRAEKERILTRC